MKKALMFSLAGIMLGAPLAQAADPVAENASKPSSPHAGAMVGSWFTKADANADGVITKEEFMAEPEQRFIETDTDKDGKITKVEADAQKEKWRARLKEERAKRQAEREKMKAEQGKVQSAKPAEKPVAPVTPTPAAPSDKTTKPPVAKPAE